MVRIAELFYKLFWCFIFIIFIFGCSSNTGSKDPMKTVESLGVQGKIGVLGNQFTLLELPARDVFVQDSLATTSSAGLGGGTSGFFTQVWDYYGGDTWKISVFDRNGNVVGQYTAGKNLAFPVGNVAFDSEALRMAYTMNEPGSVSSDRQNITYIYEISNGTLLKKIVGYESPLFLDNGELLLRKETGLSIFDKDLNFLSTLPIRVAQINGAYAGSPDGRYIVYVDGSILKGFDRSKNAGWDVTELTSNSYYGPAFSPDGSTLALLKSGNLGLAYLHAIKFQPFTTKRVSDLDLLKTSTNELIDGKGSIFWVR